MRGGAIFCPVNDAGVYCLCNLQLHPVWAPIRNVGAVGSLRDDPFQAILFCQREQLFSVFRLMIGVAKPFGGAKQSVQELLAIEERGFTKVVSVTVEKIEGEVDDRDLREQVLAGSTHVHAFLQAFEVAVTASV